MIPTASSDFPSKHFIVTVGRTGSSLLCAVLADASADFGMKAPKDWDPRRGVMENFELRRAAHHYRRAWDIDHGRLFNLSPVLESKWRRYLGRRCLARALTQAQFFKGSDVDLLTQPVFKLGYLPKLILSYRGPQATLASLLVGRTHAGPDQLASEYVRVYRQGIALLRCFGGCVVPYAELKSGSFDWRTITELTGLAEKQLIAAAAHRSAGGEEEAIAGSPYPEADQIFDALQEMRGLVVPVSRQICRVLGEG